MRAVWQVALITYKEGIKNRVLFGTFMIALMLFAATTVVALLFMRDIVKVAVDLSLSTVSFSGLLTLLFVGLNLFSKDLDKKTIYMVISRPISRSEYLVGKFLGIILLNAAVVALLGVLSAIPVAISKNIYYYPEATFNWWIFIAAIVYILVKLALLTSVMTLFASFTSNAFIALILSLVSYFIGQTAESVRTLLTSGVEGITVNPILSRLIDVAYYVFPNVAAFDLKTQAAHGIHVNASYFLWTMLYAVLYMTVTISVATLAFRRREFP